jgi:hypothetical protein
LHSKLYKCKYQQEMIPARKNQCEKVPIRKELVHE